MMRNPTLQQQKQQGFTLVELAVTLSVLAIIAGTAFMEMIAGSALLFQQETTKRMLAIEDALRTHYQAFGYLPCPSPGNYGPTDSGFGRPTTETGACDQGEVLSTANTAMGAVPVKTLALPDEYALDGWGHKIMYMVSLSMTDSSDDPDVPIIDVLDASGGTSIATAVAVLMSFGEDGNGAFPAYGSDVDDRISVVDSPNADEEENTHLANSAGYDDEVVSRNFTPDGTIADRFGQIIFVITEY